MVKSPAEVSGTFDYIICANKAIDPDAAVSQLQPAVDETKTTIVIIQNGVGNEELFRKKLPGCSIITCVVFLSCLKAISVPSLTRLQTWTGATQTSSGIVEHNRSEDMQIGLFPNSSVDQAVEQTRLNTFASLLEDGKTRFRTLTDIQRQRWEKVVWNVAWNSLTTLTLLDTQSWLHSSSEATSLTERLMREVIDVGRGCGVELEYGLIDRLMARIKAMPGIGSSMQTDCKNGRPMEIDVIVGFPLQKSKEFGMDTPVLETIHALLRAVDVRLRTKL